MQTFLPGRSYNIKNNALHFYAGHLKNGSQVLMGLQLPDLVMVEFDADGSYLTTLVKAVSLAAEDSFQSPLDSDEDDVMVIRLRDWQREVGFTAGTISIKQFFMPDRWIGIKDLPDHYQEVLDHPDNYDSERRTELQNDARLWMEQGNFVLYWDEEYYLNQDGELESS